MFRLVPKIIFYIVIKFISIQDSQVGEVVISEVTVEVNVYDLQFPMLLAWKNEVFLVGVSSLILMITPFLPDWNGIGTDGANLHGSTLALTSRVEFVQIVRAVNVYDSIIVAYQKEAFIIHRCLHELHFGRGVQTKFEKLIYLV